jgi:MFS family permease
VPLWTRDFAALCLLNFLSFSGFWMLPPLLPVYIHDLGAPEYLLGWIAGITSLATIVARPLAGLAVECYGRRGVLTIGLIGMVATSVSFAFIPLIGVVLALRFIQGLFWGMNNTAIATVATDNIPKPRYAEGMGWYGQGSSLAQILGPALSLAVFYRIGAEASVLICAGFFLLALGASCFITYRRIDASERVRMGEQVRRSAGIRQFVASTLLERRALFAALMMFFAATAYGAIQSYLAIMVESRQIAGVEWFFVISAVFSFFGRPAFGAWADRRGYREPALVGFVVLSLGLGLLVFVDSTPGLLVAAALQGLGYSTCFSLFLAMAGHGVASDRRGSAIATVMIGFDLGAGGGSILFGVIAGFLGLSTVFIIAALLPLVAVVLYLALKRR